MGYIGYCISLVTSEPTPVAYSGISPVKAAPGLSSPAFPHGVPRSSRISLSPWRLSCWRRGLPWPLGLPGTDKLHFHRVTWVLQGGCCGRCDSRGCHLWYLIDRKAAWWPFKICDFPQYLGMVGCLTHFVQRGWNRQPDNINYGRTWILWLWAMGTNHHKKG